DHRVVDLDEVGLLGGDDVGELVVRLVAVVGQADVLHLALRLELARQGQLGAPVAQVVHGQQLDVVGAQAAQRVGELRLAGSAVVGGQLAGQEDALAQAQLGKQVAQHVLGIGIVGRGVDDGGAAVHEDAQHFAQRLAARHVHLEAAGGAGADDRDQLAGGGDGAPEHGAGLRPGSSGQGGQGPQGGGAGNGEGG